MILYAIPVEYHVYQAIDHFLVAICNFLAQHWDIFSAVIAVGIALTLTYRKRRYFVKLRNRDQIEGLFGKMHKDNSRLPSLVNRLAGSNNAALIEKCLYDARKMDTCTPGYFAPAVYRLIHLLYQNQEGRRKQYDGTLKSEVINCLYYLTEIFDKNREVSEEALLLLLWLLDDDDNPKHLDLLQIFDKALFKDEGIKSTKVFKRHLERDRVLKEEEARRKKEKEEAIGALISEMANGNPEAVLSLKRSAAEILVANNPAVISFLKNYDANKLPPSILEYSKERGKLRWPDKNLDSLFSFFVSLLHDNYRDEEISLIGKCFNSTIDVLSRYEMMDKTERENKGAIRALITNKKDEWKKAIEN